MRRLPIAIALAVACLLAAVAASPAALAQEDEHPVVGAWLVDPGADDSANPPASVVFGADGTYIEADPEDVGVGSWESTGERSAAVTFDYHDLGPDGISTFIVREDVTVSEDGETFTATYTLEFVGPDGISMGQLGPGSATGTRIAIEPMGAPVAPLPEPSAPADQEPPVPSEGREWGRGPGH